MKAEGIPSPELLFVTVNQDTKTVTMQWIFPEKEPVNGFAILRKIDKHPLAAPGSYQTIDFINDSLRRTYTDTSQIFGKTNPYLHPETYRILAYKVVGTDTLFSLPGEEHKSIFLTGLYKECDYAAGLQWNPYRAWGNNFSHYEIFCQSGGDTIFHKVKECKTLNDTSIIVGGIINFTPSRYYIKAVRKSGEVSFSNRIEITPISPNIPEYIQLDSLLVKETGQKEIFFHIPEHTDARYYTLYAEGTGGRFDSLQSLQVNGGEYYSFKNISGETNRSQRYYIAAKNNCPNTIKHSDTVASIVLHTPPETPEEIFLQWSSEGEFTDYRIYKTENEAKKYIATSFANEYHYHLSNGNHIENTEIQCMQIAGQKDNFYSYSNIVCPVRDYICRFPNAFNPNSEIDENRVFLPKIRFVSDFIMQIYTEFGALIFESTDIHQAWDGRLPNGKEAPRGAYLYWVSFKDTRGKLFRKKGTVVLLR